MQENPNNFEKQTDEMQETVDQAQTVASESESSCAAEMNATEEQLKALEAELAESKDMCLRVHADFENYRRRMQDEVASAHKYAISKFAHDMATVKDYLEMALKDQSGQIDVLKMGVDMTLKQMISAFDKVQLKDIDPKIGDKLDPHHHQAMSAEESDAEPNTVIRVMQKGYQISDRVLRPAMVVVAKAKA